MIKIRGIFINFKTIFMEEFILSAISIIRRMRIRVFFEEIETFKVSPEGERSDSIMTALAGLLDRVRQHLPHHEQAEGRGGEEEGVAAVNEGEKRHAHGNTESVGDAVDLHPVVVARFGRVGQFEAADHADDTGGHGERSETVGEGPEDEEDEGQASREGVDHGLPHGVLLVGHHDEASHQEDGGNEEELLVFRGTR